MKTQSYSQTRQHLAATLDSVTNDREPVIITRAGREPVVMMSVGEYESLQETAYLMRSPENARRLTEAIAELEAGRGKERALLDPDA